MCCHDEWECKPTRNHQQQAALAPHTLQFMLSRFIACRRHHNAAVPTIRLFLTHGLVFPNVARCSIFDEELSCSICYQKSNEGMRMGKIIIETMLAAKMYKLIEKQVGRLLAINGGGRLTIIDDGIVASTDEEFEPDLEVYQWYDGSHARRAEQERKAKKASPTKSTKKSTKKSKKPTKP
jgi:hypothetical protein